MRPIQEKESYRWLRGGEQAARTERQNNPHPKGSLAYAAWACGRLGGWTGYYGKPGPIVMLQGWLDFQAAKRGVSALTAQLNG